MSLTLETATVRIGRELRESEDAIAEALVACSALLHTAALAQRDVGVASPAQAQRTFSRLLKMNSGLVDVRGEAMRVHGELLDLARETGATEEPTCPEKKVFTTGQIAPIAA